MKLVRSLLLLFLFGWGTVFAQSNPPACPGSLIIKYQNGDKGCLTDLPLSQLVDKRWKSKIFELARTSGHYLIAASLKCDVVSIGITVYNPPPSVDYAKQQASIDALSSCPSECSCSIVVDDGIVLVPQNLASLYGAIKSTNSDKLNLVGSAPLKQASVTNQTVPLVAVQPDNSERDRLTAEVEIERKKRQELEKDLALNKEQERLAYEARIKEQQRLALEASEISRLRAESQESKRKQVELEEQLRLAKQQIQVNPSSAMTTMANRKALVIGNDTYKSVTKLLNAREDAIAVASNLTTVGYKVTLQLDLNEKEMKAALRTFSSQVQGGDEVMFFFAGHGVQLGATNYLLPTDIGGESEAQVKDEAIQLQRVLDDMTEKKAKFTLAMIDACRDNPFKATGRNIGGRGLAPTTAATGQMVVFSAGTGQQALDRLGSSDKDKNGVFTRTFLKEMQKPGVSIDRIIKNVRNEVAALAKTIGHEQVPAIYDQVLGDFYFKK
jgi:hypothetical protein